MPWSVFFFYHLKELDEKHQTQCVTFLIRFYFFGPIFFIFSRFFWPSSISWKSMVPPQRIWLSDGRDWVSPGMVWVIFSIWTYEAFVHSVLFRIRALQLCGTQETSFLGAKSTSILDCVGWSVGPSVGPPRCAITWKNNSYVAIDLRRRGGRGHWLRRDSITARPSHLGIRRSPCF
jgi:hypothetical protein